MNRQNVVRHKHGAHTTKSARARREWLLRAGVWAFILVFAFSVIGGLMIISQAGNTGTTTSQQTKAIQVPGNTYLPNGAISPAPANKTAK